MTVKGSNTVTLKGILVGEVWFCSGQSNMAGKFVAAKGRTLPPEVFEMDLSGFRFTAQYHPPVAKVFESIETCPDEHLLFFHHAPYTHRLHSGKTVIQHIYDSHFDGVEQVKTFRAEGFTLSGQIDAERHAHVLKRLDEQIEHAALWRDTINSYFLKMSGIKDAKGRNIPKDSY